MELFKKIGTALLIIIFPLGLIYCIFHTLGKEITTFIGGISLLAIGVLLHMYLVQPDIFHNLFNNIVSVFTLINN